MTTLSPTPDLVTSAPASRFSVFLRRLKSACQTYAKDPASLAALSFLLLVAVVAIFAPYVAPYDPHEMIGWRNSLPGEDGLFLGADGDGRDVLSRLIWGWRVSLLTGVVPTLLSMVVSLLVGITEPIDWRARAPYESRTNAMWRGNTGAWICSGARLVERCGGGSVFPYADQPFPPS